MFDQNHFYHEEDQEIYIKREKERGRKNKNEFNQT